MPAGLQSSVDLAAAFADRTRVRREVAQTLEMRESACRKIKYCKYLI